MIDAAAELVELALAGRRAVHECARRIVGVRHDGEQLLHGRIRHGRTLRFGGNLRLDRRHLASLAPFIARKEERLVPFDGPAYTVAVYVAFERRDRSRGVEEILGVEPLVADELKGAAVHAVRTRL